MSVRNVPLPPIFAQYEPLVQYIQKVNDFKYTSTCPRCKGDIHQEGNKRGEWPDRCVWFLDAKPLGHCFTCKETFFPDQAPGYEPPTQEEMERFRQERIREQREREAKAQEARAFFESTQIWEQYHRQMDFQARQLWRKRGIPDFWQDYWQFGVKPEWRFKQDNGNYAVTPSLTIPLFDHTWTCLNIKHRLVTPPANRGKYLYELFGQAQPAFLANPDRDLAGHVYAVEGEIKAAVLMATLQDWDARIVGLPGKSPSPDLLQQFEQAERITLIMDPDAKQAAWELCKTLGRKRCFVLIPPVKIDDGIIAAHMPGFEVRALLREALPAA